MERMRKEEDSITLADEAAGSVPNTNGAGLAGTLDAQFELAVNRAAAAIVEESEVRDPREVMEGQRAHEQGE